jgi:hypothetical protein
MKFEGYVPLFELGVIDDKPSVLILAEGEISPVGLAALTTTLFEAVMKNIDEKDQIDYEKTFNKSLRVLMKTRHNYEVTYEYIKTDNEDPEE